MQFAPLSGRFWRAIFEGDDAQLLKPAGAPAGRWHHNGQTALYCSMQPDACRVSINLFATADDPRRMIHLIEVTVDRIVDLRIPQIRDDLNTSLSDIHADWKEERTSGQPAATWLLSDRLRKLGAQGILSPSRSRPDLTHLTLFDWNSDTGASVKTTKEQPLSF